VPSYGRLRYTNSRPSLIRLACVRIIEWPLKTQRSRTGTVSPLIFTLRHAPAHAKERFSSRSEAHRAWMLSETRSVRARDEKLFTALGRLEGSRGEGEDVEETAVDGRRRRRRRVINPRFFSSN